LTEQQAARSVVGREGVGGEVGGGVKGLRVVQEGEG